MKKRKTIFIVVLILLLAILIKAFTVRRALLCLFGTDVKLTHGNIPYLVADLTVKERLSIASACLFSLWIPESMTESVQDYLGIHPSSNSVDVLLSYPDLWPVLYIYGSRDLPVVYVCFEDNESPMVSFISIGNLCDRLLDHLKEVM